MTTGVGTDWTSLEQDWTIPPPPAHRAFKILVRGFFWACLYDDPLLRSLFVKKISGKMRMEMEDGILKGERGDNKDGQ